VAKNVVAVLGDVVAVTRFAILVAVGEIGDYSRRKWRLFSATILAVFGD